MRKILGYVIGNYIMVLFPQEIDPLISSLRKGNPVGIWFLAHSNAEKYIEKSELRQPLPNLNFPEFKTLFL